MHPKASDDPCGPSTLVPDAAFAAAYDATPPERRADLKTCIAALHALFGEKPSSRLTSVANQRLGMAFLDGACPVPWAVICLDPAYASGPRLLAALMPALLAGVHDVRVVRLAPSGSSWPAPVLTALELAGQEQAHDLDLSGLVALLEHRCAQGRGRLVLLGEAPSSSGIVEIARRASVPVWMEGAPPRIVIDTYASIDREVVRWAHPDADILHAEDAVRGRCQARMSEDGLGADRVVEDDQSAGWPVASFRHGLSGGPDAVCCSVSDAPAWMARTPRVLMPGREGCWVHPDLSPDFFFMRSLAFGTSVPPTLSAAETFHE